MKAKFFIIAAMACLFAVTSHAQAFSPVTQQYLQVKKALAADDAAHAATAAAGLKQDITKISTQSLSAKLHPVFMQQQKELLKESNAIASTRDLATQRKAFTALSKSMIALAKADKISKDALYEAYCPMKKASWLSETKTITNPYYGDAMLTCGKVTATY